MLKFKVTLAAPVRTYFETVVEIEANTEEEAQALALDAVNDPEREEYECEYAPDFEVIDGEEIFVLEVKRV